MHSLIHLFRSVLGELEPGRLQKKFLDALLEVQRVERGSIWIKEGAGYRCVEASGHQCEAIRGRKIGSRPPSVVGWVIENGRMAVADPKTDTRHRRDIEEGLAVKSSQILCFPLLLKTGEVYGAVQLIDTAVTPRSFSPDSGHLGEMAELVEIGADALSNALLYSRERTEKTRLQTALDAIRGEPVLVGQAPAFLTAVERMANYAGTPYPVLITGESGTGKELFARRIHALSPRATHPFLVQNCTAIPESLLESELFGYRKGAFSGALDDRIGLFEAAHGGTLFLDEIGDMPMDIQAKLLRVLQDGEIKPLGSTEVRKTDVRILSATHRDLRSMVEAKAFREDLFFRLSVLPLPLPALRERREDIPLLLLHFLEREASRMGIESRGFQPDAVRCLTRYSWAGNVRELENLVRYLLVVASGRPIEAADFPSHIPVRKEDRSMAVPSEVSGDLPEAPGGPIHFGDRTWAEVEREYALYLLERHRWNMTHAAAAARINRSTFTSRLRKMGIRRRKTAPSHGATALREG